MMQLKRFRLSKPVRIILCLITLSVMLAFYVHATVQQQKDARLIAAIEAEDSAAVRTALKAGASPNACDSQGTPALLLYVFHGKDSPEPVKLLLDAGADPDRSCNEVGVTPLMWAARINATQILKALLQGGAHMEQRNDSEETALHYAMMDTRTDTLVLLLDAGADVNAQSRDGETPLHWACMYPHKEGVALLLQHKADPNLRVQDGASPLAWALHLSDDQTVQLLRQNGAKLFCSGSR